jgi:hypothetical protein
MEPTPTGSDAISAALVALVLRENLSLLSPRRSVEESLEL